MKIKNSKDSVILDFPTVRQSTLDTCSCASIQACLAYYGIDRREITLRNMMNINRYVQEVRPQKMVKVLKKHGVNGKYRKLSISDLKRYIKRGIPVIVNFQAWSTATDPDYSSDDNGHYATVIGFDDAKKCLIFSDSASFNKTWISYDEFEQRWHDGYPDRWDYKHMGIVVKGRRASYNSRRIVKGE